VKRLGPRRGPQDAPLGPLRGPGRGLSADNLGIHCAVAALQASTRLPAAPEPQVCLESPPLRCNNLWRLVIEKLVAVIFLGDLEDLSGACGASLFLVSLPPPLLDATVGVVRLAALRTGGCS
jgi:hypothetical protein